MPFPTPYEFSLYFLNEMPLMGDVLNINRHFAAQFTQCPFCSLPFDLVGSKETFDQDIRNLFDGVNLTEKLDINLKQNSRQISEENSTLEFFAQLPKSISEKIFRYYELDFDLFGYDKSDALKYIQAGLED